MIGWFTQLRQNMNRPVTTGEAIFYMCIMPAIATVTFMLLLVLVGRS